MANENLVLPFTRPVSAWDVLEHIKTLAEDEPKRVVMRFELAMQGICGPRDIEFPACGTVGCVAGWTEFLFNCSAENPNRNLIISARRRLGLTIEQSNELFLPWGWLWDFYMNAQTPEFAQRLVRHISDFQRKYEEQLKNHMCPTGVMEI